MFRICFFLAIALSGVLSALEPGGHLDYEAEYRVKAACLYGFARYVEWPKTEGSKQFSIGILGKDPFGETLEKIVQQKTVGGRAVVIRHLRSAEQAKECEMVYLGSPEMLAGLLRAVAHAGVLTVGESRQFTAGGGMIGFVMVDESVRFDVNTAGIAKAGLMASARLLQLASSVSGESKVRP